MKRGLCERAEDWEWSSFLQYATGCSGRVEIECEWAARRRERAAGELRPAIELPRLALRGLLQTLGLLAGTLRTGLESK